MAFSKSNDKPRKPWMEQMERDILQNLEDATTQKPKTADANEQTTEADQKPETPQENTAEERAAFERFFGGIDPTKLF